MKMKKIKAACWYICFLLIALSFFFVTCKDGDTKIIDDEYENPYAGQSGDILFSHKSGVYNAGFSLSLKSVVEGRDIYYTTNGSIPVPGKSGTTKYTSLISIINRNDPVQARVLSATANHNRMFMNSTDNTRIEGDGKVNRTSPTSLDDNKVPKATVIRAVAVDGNNKSEVLTRTYFVGTNAQLFGDTKVRIISLVAEPDDLISDARGILVTGGTNKVWEHTDENMMYNYRRRGTDWERAASFELFDANSKTSMISTNVGIRIRGGWSRGIGQKSFNIYFRSNNDLKGLEPNAILTGINNFVRNDRGFELIPGAVNSNGQPVSTTKSFMLRSGGNDADQTKFYDVFIHDSLKDRKITTQASQPIILYLNGEYWGPYNMSERYSDNHLEYKYGVPRSEIISIDNGQLDDGNPGEDADYWEVINGMISSGTFNHDRMDIDNFVDYFTAQIYINNEDWPHNNYIVWRTRGVVAGNSYGDKRWRYSLHDTEFSMGIYNNGAVSNPFSKFNGGGHEHNRLLYALLVSPGDPNVKQKFKDAMHRLIDVNFNPINFEPKINAFATAYKPLMGPDYRVPGYNSRWGGWGSQVFDQNVNNAKKYLNNMRTLMPGYLNNFVK